MTIKSSRVFGAWASLPQAERNEVVALINEFIKGNDEAKRSMTEQHVREGRGLVEKSAAINFGPVPGQGCPMCGK